MGDIELGKEYWIDVRCPSAHAGKRVKAIRLTETTDVLVQVNTWQRALIGRDWLTSAEPQVSEVTATEAYERVLLALLNKYEKNPTTSGVETCILIREVLSLYKT